MFTYNISTSVGKVRMLISDVDENRPARQIFQDDEIGAFLDLNSANVLLSAAMALSTIAANEVMIQKKMKTLDTQTDGPAVAAELRALAKQLREQAMNPPGGEGFDIAEMVYDAATYEERVWNQVLRNST